MTTTEDLHGITVFDRTGKSVWRSKRIYSLPAAAREAIRQRRRGRNASVWPAFDRDQLRWLREAGLGRDGPPEEI